MSNDEFEEVAIGGQTYRIKREKTYDKTPRIVLRRSFYDPPFDYDKAVRMGDKATRQYWLFVDGKCVDVWCVGPQAHKWTYQGAGPYQNWDLGGWMWFKSQSSVQIGGWETEEEYRAWISAHKEHKP